MFKKKTQHILHIESKKIHLISRNLVFFSEKKSPFLRKFPSFLDPITRKKILDLLWWEKTTFSFLEKPFCRAPWFFATNYVGFILALEPIKNCGAIGHQRKEPQASPPVERCRPGGFQG